MLRTGLGVEALAQALEGKISVFAGPSGVGKSSLLNVLRPNLHLKVGEMKNEFGVGRHTTTASEIYRLGRNLPTLSLGGPDPHFSLAELKHPEPGNVAWMFPEISRLSQECRYSNCLHLIEQGCNILSNLATISPVRYQSYVVLVNEAPG